MNHIERLKLKISPKGQITLPKKVREQLFTGDYVHLNLEKDKAILEPVSFIDEFEDLILRDVQKEGYAAEEEELCGSASVRAERAIRHTEE